jgi:hypothetical protein
MDVKNHFWTLPFFIGFLWLLAFVFGPHRAMFLLLAVVLFLASFGEWVRTHPRK